MAAACNALTAVDVDVAAATETAATETAAASAATAAAVLFPFLA